MAYTLTGVRGNDDDEFAFQWMRQRMEVNSSGRNELPCYSTAPKSARAEEDTVLGRIGNSQKRVRKSQVLTSLWVIGMLK